MCTNQQSHTVLSNNNGDIDKYPRSNIPSVLNLLGKKLALNLNYNLALWIWQSDLVEIWNEVCFSRLIRQKNCMLEKWRLQLHLTPATKLVKQFRLILKLTLNTHTSIDSYCIKNAKFLGQIFILCLTFSCLKLAGLKSSKYQLSGHHYWINLSGPSTVKNHRKLYISYGESVT